MIQPTTRLLALPRGVGLMLVSICAGTGPGATEQPQGARSQDTARVRVVEAPGRARTPPEEGPTARRDASFRLSAKALTPGTVLLGTPLRAGDKRGTRYCGTGFVISKRKRLVVTAAHVADSFSFGGRMWAVIGGGRQAYRITQAWYHPGTQRMLDYGLYVSSYDPKDGEIAFTSPDVAVLELSGGGPDPPVQLELASDSELRTLQRRPIGILGYQGPTLKRAWPTTDCPAGPSLGTCTIGFALSVAQRVGTFTSVGRGQCLRFDADLGAGASGGPIFLGSGHVVGLVSRGGGRASTRALYPDSGCRIDLVQELIAYHHLAEQRGTQPPARQRADWGRDPRVGELRKAVGLLNKATSLLRRRDYRGAEEICKAALSISPNYGNALLVRSLAYLYSMEDAWNKFTPVERAAYARRAYALSLQCNRAYPEFIMAWLVTGQNLVYLARTGADVGGSAEVLEKMEPELGRIGPDQRLTDNERSFLFSVCAQAHHLRGEAQQAETMFRESIRLDPSEPQWYLYRASFWEQRDRKDLADSDRATAGWLALIRHMGCCP